MHRLPFRLPEFAPRTTWASAHAREVWEPRIQRISNAYMAVERELVIARVRESALQNVTPEELPALMKALAPQGIIALPLTKTARAAGYQSASRALGVTEPWDYRVAITRPEHAAAWAAAWDTSDNEAIGSLLGYPACCRAFFERVWVKERWMDTTWPMTQVPAPHSPDSRSALAATGHTAFSLQSPRDPERAARESIGREGAEASVTAIVQPGINMLWRWHGVRTVSHLPCSFGCTASMALGRRALDVMQDRWPEEAQWMLEILSWPVKWTALYGIAEITTPITRTSVTTDAFNQRREVRYMGAGYPAEGAIGVGFPHMTVTTQKVTLHVARPSARNPAVNGFSSIAAQTSAHNTLLAAIGPGPFDTVVDLGCGDGSLLMKIPARRRIGFESDPVKAKLAAEKLNRVVTEDCTNPVFLELLHTFKPDLIIAQRDRNPAHTLDGYRVLSYSYEAGADAPQLIEATDGRRRLHPGSGFARTG